MNWFFIMGCPRSGTTMLQQALNRNPCVAIPPETAYFTFLTRSYRRQLIHFRRIQQDLGIHTRLPNRRVSDLAAGKALYESIAKAYIDRVGRVGITHFGDKSPEHLRRFRSIRAYYPKAKFILIYRDGRDVALSLSKMPWMPPNVYVGFALWLHYARIALQVASETGSYLHLVRYEDLVQDPERELVLVCRFLGLSYQPGMVHSFASIEGIPQWEMEWKWRATQPITDTRIGLWKSELTCDQIANIERWGSRTLTSLGYKLATEARGYPPLSLLIRVYWLALQWIMTRPGFGDVTYSSNCINPSASND